MEQKLIWKKIYKSLLWETCQSLSPKGSRVPNRMSQRLHPSCAICRDWILTQIMTIRRDCLLLVIREKRNIKEIKRIWKSFPPESLQSNKDWFSWWRITKARTSSFKKSLLKRLLKKAATILEWVQTSSSSKNYRRWRWSIEHTLETQLVKTRRSRWFCHLRLGVEQEHLRWKICTTALIQTSALKKVY